MLAYCNVEDFKLFLFHRNLVTTRSKRTIIQAAKNNVNSNTVKRCDNQWRVNLFFEAISEVLDFQLSGILRKISTQTHLLGIDEKELPYLREENMANFSLLRGLYLNKVV